MKRYLKKVSNGITTKLGWLNVIFVLWAVVFIAAFIAAGIYLDWQLF